jgi:hypothetical protein
MFCASYANFYRALAGCDSRKKRQKVGRKKGRERGI